MFSMSCDEVGPVLIVGQLLHRPLSNAFHGLLTQDQLPTWPQCVVGERRSWLKDPNSMNFVMNRVGHERRVLLGQNPDHGFGFRLITGVGLVIEFSFQRFLTFNAATPEAATPACELCDRIYGALLPPVRNCLTDLPRSVPVGLTSEHN